MVFKRRTRRGFGEALLAVIYPRGGWRRAVSYVGHRLSRLPDTPHRIALGVAAGTLSSFTPLFGLHFILAALIARAIGGNILAALLGTFFGNPLTFPLIVEVSVQFGSWILGQSSSMHVPQVMAAFGYAWAEFWGNTVKLLTGQPMRWVRMETFFSQAFLPYLVGGMLPGLLAATVMYGVSLPLIKAYQARRQRKLRQRFERLRQASRSTGVPAQDDTTKETEP